MFDNPNPLELAQSVYLAIRQEAVIPDISPTESTIDAAASAEMAISMQISKELKCLAELFEGAESPLVLTYGDLLQSSEEDRRLLIWQRASITDLQEEILCVLCRYKVPSITQFLMSNEPLIFASRFLKSSISKKHITCAQAIELIPLDAQAQRVAVADYLGSGNENTSIRSKSPLRIVRSKSRSRKPKLSSVLRYINAIPSLVSCFPTQHKQQIINALENVLVRLRPELLPQSETECS